jgi:hypothetical protein
MGPPAGLTDVAAALAAVLVVAAGIVLWRGLSLPRDPGRRGERAVADSVAAPDGVLVLRNVAVSSGAHRAELDLLLVGAGALLVVEAKNLRGRLVPGPGDWLYETRSGPRFMPAPTRQAARQVRLLRRHLRRLDCPWASWPIGACVVLAGPGTLAPGPLPADVPVLRLPELAPYVRAYFARHGRPAAVSAEEAAVRAAWAERLTRAGSGADRPAGIGTPVT